MGPFYLKLTTSRFSLVSRPCNSAIVLWTETEKFNFQFMIIIFGTFVTTFKMALSFSGMYIVYEMLWNGALYNGMHEIYRYAIVFCPSIYSALDVSRVVW